MINFITPQIVHVDMPSMYQLSSLFIRIQEFYECPNDQFRGKYFTLDDYMDWYSSNQVHGKFSYFEDWAGFNIPGYSLIDFWNLYIKKEGTLRNKEMNLFSHIMKFVINNDPKFYVIGTVSADKHILEHEMRHAKYYLDDNYRERCDKIFNQLPKAIKTAVTFNLLKMGYSDSVVPDETQAYFGTECPASIKSMFNLAKSPKQWVNKYKNITP